MIDCCPFSEFVRLIAHEVSGGWEDYRNSSAFKKAEVECVLWVFFSCNLGRSCRKTFLHVSFVCVCLWVYQGLLVDIRYKKIHKLFINETLPIIKKQREENRKKRINGKTVVSIQTLFLNT